MARWAEKNDHQLATAPVAPLLDQMEANLHAAEIRKRPREFVADAGDYSDDNTQTVQSHNLIPYSALIPYLATQRLKHHEELPPVPRGRIPISLTPKPRMARTLRTQTGRATYQKRKGPVEPACLPPMKDSLPPMKDSGQIKHAGGFRQFAMQQPPPPAGPKRRGSRSKTERRSQTPLPWIARPPLATHSSRT